MLLIQMRAMPPPSAILLQPNHIFHIHRLVKHQLLYSAPNHAQAMQLMEHRYARHFVASELVLFDDEAAVWWEERGPVAVCACGEVEEDGILAECYARLGARTEIC
jgi:hypothetical protein